ncbi:CDP-diacylglycerol--serine O-phosphatidyltransferase [Polyangium sp. 6x1]|uniref:CDP-diacylglycerol--serine O-phosphatidyltransferase n=1 Tax=Polyangium sp. 6x1 TaxID=3042689 RepID=UPI002482EF05|nr:CDP-diacylglycerol--serine O-phosphatidyltransferase [Polyangium sp. 6x1]MDI1446629.1 CDP-diacylglycerol--serine O-phosphatidyltransferase [Polyangium sp. 6x1]
MGKGIRLRKFELKKTLFLLPNMITLTSIFCGFDSIRTSATAQGEADFYRAALLIVFAMFFDTLDGRVARATKTQSAFGLQIDSLADVVSFGVAPSLLLYQWTLNRFGTLGLVASFMFTACGAIRLARFNVLSTGDDGKPSKPSKYIVGLPIPGAAGILVSLVVASHAAGGILGRAEYAVLMLAVTIGLSMLMVSTIRFRSFKDVKLNARTALLVVFMVGSSVVVSLKMQPAFVLVWLLGCYVTMGILESLWHLPRRLRASLLARDSTEPPPAAST